MKVPFFDLSAQLTGYKGELLAEFEKIIESGVFVGGARVSEFEKSFARFVGTEHAIGVGNGLDAIRLILESLGVGPGDEVIVPGFTFYATWLAVVQVGAIPVFADVKLTDASINESQIEFLITDKTKAVLVVHLFGNMANIVELKKITDSHGLYLIEDVAQAHGAVRDGLNAGTVGVASAFSFYPTKNLGALGDAGAVVTNNATIAQIIRSRRSYGIGGTKYQHVDTGWNSRLDPLQAAVLSIHLKKIDLFTEKRRSIASVYLASMDGFENNVVGPLDVSKSVWHHFVIRAKNRDSFREAMLSRGISTDVHYPYSPLTVDPMAIHLEKTQLLAQEFLENSELLRNSVVSLPMGPWMTADQIQIVADALQELKDDL